MKKILFTLLVFSLSTFAAQDGLPEARELGERGIIVNQSTMAGPANESNLGTMQEASMYRLSDALIRQEALGVALKLKGITLSDYYMCRNYFRDTSEWWVCRSAEMAADYGLVTRANLFFRPHDTLTLAEALGITMNSLDISLSTTSTTTIPGTLPAWQKRLILTIQEQQIPLDVRDDNGRGIALYDSRVGSILSGFDMSHRLTRGEFFQVVIALLHYSENQDPLAHCTVYNDGCNDCTGNMEVTQCTERQCFWKGIPSCSACEAGYTIQNSRCVKTQTACIQEGQYAGGGYVYPPENPSDFVCCSGLKTAPHKDSNLISDIGNTCIREGDGYCDSRYENDYNSADCRTMTTFDDSICQSYSDGCNSCSRTSEGQIMCTLRACFVNGPAYCTTYTTYTPINQTTDQQFVDKVFKEIQNYTKDLSCTSTSQCQWKLFGKNPCGSSSVGIKYSSKNIDMTLFENKTTYYTNMQTLFNQTYPVFGTCAVMTSPPPLSCVNGTCAASY